MQIKLSLIGATLLAVGTSLPELALEIHAIRKKEYSLALGDIFGSSLLNISLVLGILLLMNDSVDLSVGKIVFPFLILAITLTLIRLIPAKPIKRIDGFAYLVIFTLYLITLSFSHFAWLNEPLLG